MGADVAIAVNVGSGTDEGPAPTSLFAILGQTIDSMMTTGTRMALKSADIVVVPDLKGLTGADWRRVEDRKSTRLNSSHLVISYAVFCLKKENSNDDVI